MLIATCIVPGIFPWAGQELIHVTSLKIAFKIFPLLLVFGMLGFRRFVVLKDELVKRAEKSVDLGRGIRWVLGSGIHKFSIESFNLFIEFFK